LTLLRSSINSELRKGEAGEGKTLPPFGHLLPFEDLWTLTLLFGGQAGEVNSNPSRSTLLIDLPLTREIKQTLEFGEFIKKEGDGIIWAWHWKN